ncbi:MAG: cardiolipin synthase, partial [Mesorhizobium sp.]
AEDWRFASNEALKGDAWQVERTAPPPGQPMLVRAVATGPDAANETNHKLLMGAFSVARKSIRIMSPYFLPDRELISALTTAGARGVEIDIVVPAVNNLFLVDRAMTAQFDQVLKHYCRVWRHEGPFDHSKLMAIDGAWAYVGSSNLDARSLRLNFEIDMEVLDANFARAIEARIDAAIASAKPVTLEMLRARAFVIRVLDRLLWLGSPYL